MLKGDDLVRFYERLCGPFIHMAQGDKAIWVRYLMSGGSAWAPFTYDVRVGNGVEMPSGSLPLSVKAAFALTTKRIDAVNFGREKIRIIEVKLRAGASAVGQLITYRDLFVRTYPNTPPIEMWLITDQLQPDMISVLIETGINYIEVGY